MEWRNNRLRKNDRSCNRLSKQTCHKTRNKQKNLRERKINWGNRRESQMERYASYICCLFRSAPTASLRLFVCRSHDVSNLDDLHAGSFRLKLFTFEWQKSIFGIWSERFAVCHRSCELLSLKARFHFSIDSIWFIFDFITTVTSIHPSPTCVRRCQSLCINFIFSFPFLRHYIVAVRKFRCKSESDTTFAAWKKWEIFEKWDFFPISSANKG